MALASSNEGNKAASFKWSIRLIISYDKIKYLKIIIKFFYYKIYYIILNDIWRYIWIEI